MALFNGTFVQNFDQKGRISIPALFRGALRDGVANQAALPAGPCSLPLVLRPSEKVNCIEGFTEIRHQKQIEDLDQLDPLSEEYDALATVLFADAYPIETDKEGRIILQDGLLEFAGLSRDGAAAFVGLGHRFQIWHPDRVAAAKDAARQANAIRMARKKAAA